MKMKVGMMHHASCSELCQSKFQPTPPPPRHSTPQGPLSCPCFESISPLWKIATRQMRCGEYIAHITTAVGVEGPVPLSFIVDASKRSGGAQRGHEGPLSLMANENEDLAHPTARLVGTLAI